MKFRFKVQAFQTDAVDAVADCFQGQPPESGLRYRIDPGVVRRGQTAPLEFNEGFRNSDIALPLAAILKNIQAVQVRQNLPVSETLKQTKVADVNLDVEMETGTGKTYCYIKTIFKLNQKYGWSKFIVVVPSIAIREGVAQSLADTAEHFLEEYGKRIRSFIYDSKALHNLESFSSDAGINVMVINVQAFNARGKDARRIYEELDDFQTRRPIDVIVLDIDGLTIPIEEAIDACESASPQSRASIAARARARWLSRWAGVRVASCSIRFTRGIGGSSAQSARYSRARSGWGSARHAASIAFRAWRI